MDNESKWVRVGESEIPTNERLLLWVKFHENEVFVMCTGYRVGTFWLTEGIPEKEIECVTHWQPLPAPPKNEEG